MKHIIPLIALVLFFLVGCKKNPEYYCKRGSILDESGNHEAAIMEYTKALDLDFKNFQAYFLRGLSKSELGDTAGAAEDFLYAVTLNPESGFLAYANAGAEYFKSGDYNKAIQNFSIALKIDSILYDQLSHNNKYTAFSLGNEDESIKPKDLYFLRGLSKYELTDTVGGDLDIISALRIDSLLIKKYRAFLNKDTKK